MSTTIDLADAVVTTVVASGTTLLLGLVWGRREKQETQRQRVQARRANRLRHRAPELEPDTETTDTTVPEPDEEFVSPRDRFSYNGAPRTLNPDWHRQFDHIVELYGETPRPDDEPTPFYDAVSAALVMPTAEWQALGRPNHPDNPWDDGGTTKPQVTIRRKRKKHAHGGSR